MKVKLEPTKTKIFVYGSSTPLKLHGCFQASINSSSRFAVSTFYVVDGRSCPYSISEHFERDKGNKGTFPSEQTRDVASVNKAGKEADMPHSEDEVIDKLLDKHKSFFMGEGKIKGQLANLHIREDITPVLQPQRRIPYHMRKTVPRSWKN